MSADLGRGRACRGDPISRRFNRNSSA